MKCQSCGRTSSQTYCNECIDQEGKLKSFEEVTENLTSYYVETQGFDREVAKSIAIGVLSHQPAWEAKLERIEKGKDMRMKTFLIATAAVFTVVGAGIAWWFGTRTKADDTIRFQNFSKLPQAPFANIVKSKVDQFEVSEMMCPADQRLVELDGDYLTMKSLEGSVYSPDYQLYTYNLKSNTGYKFIPESLATRTQLMGKGSGLVFQKANSGELINWYYSPEKGLLSPLKGQLICQYGRTALVCLNNNLIAYDTLTGTVKKEIKGADGYGASVSNNFIVYYDEKIAKSVISWFNGRQIFLPHPAMIMEVVANDAYVVIARAGEKEKSTTCFYASTGDQIWKKDYMSGLKLSPATSEQESVFSWESSKPNPNKTSEQLASADFILLGQPDSMKSVPVPEGYEAKDMFVLGVSQNLIIWDTQKHNSIYSDGSTTQAGYLSKCSIWAYDIASDLNLQLDSNNCDSVLVDGWNVAWEKYETEKDEQYTNIKLTNLFFEDKDGENGKFDSKTKINLVELMKEPLSIKEIAIKGQQTSSINDYLYVSGQTNSVIPIQFGGFSYGLFNVDTEKAARLSKDDPNLPSVLDGRSVEWMSGFENDFSHGYSIKCFYDSYDAKLKKFAEARLDETKPDYEYDIHTVKIIDSKGQKKTVFNSRYVIHFVSQQKTLTNTYLVIAIFDDSSRLSEIHVYDYRKDAITYSDHGGYKCSPEIELCGKFLLYQLSLDGWKTFDMEKGKIMGNVEGSRDLQTVFRRISYNSPEKADDPVLFTRVNGVFMSIKASDFLNKNYGKGTKVKSKIGDKEGCVQIDDHRYMISETKRKSNIENYVFYGTLTMLDDSTGKRTLISDKYLIGSFKNNGDFICWTIDRGRKDSQYTNVCFAKIKQEEK